MDVREPFSRFKRSIGRRLSGGKHKADRTGADAGGERADATGSLQCPESHVVVGSGHPDVEAAVGSGSRREGNSAGEERVERVSPTPPAPLLVCGGKTDGMWARLVELLP
jgi:hypothetical protein